MRRAFGEVWEVVADEGRSLCSAACALAFRRIGEAVGAHGTRESFQEGRPRD
jgi:glutamate dehydrogenase (NADP+)